MSFARSIMYCMAYKISLSPRRTVLPLLYRNDIFSQDALTNPSMFVM